MKEGYWINYRTGRVFAIDEHERWIRTDEHAIELGVPKRVIAGFHEFKPTTDRDKFLLFLMKKSPIMRVRGHGASVTFEFCARLKARPLSAIRSWAEQYAGPATLLNIVNLARGTSVQVPYSDFHHYLCPKPRSIADLPPDLRKRAKTMLVGPIAGAAVRPGPDGAIHVEGASACAGWDHSPEACQTRTEVLKATIPPNVMALVRGRKVMEVGVSPAKSVGRTRVFCPPTTFDDGIHRLANASCLGIYTGFITLKSGGKLVFEANTFNRYDPPVDRSRGSRQRQTHKQEDAGSLAEPENPAVTKPAGKSKAPVRSESNPFPAGSTYATVYDLLASNPAGIKNSTLVGAVARLTGKDIMKAFFDVSTVASVRQDGRSHRNVRPVAGIYYVERTDAGLLRLVVRSGKAERPGSV